MSIDKSLKDFFDYASGTPIDPKIEDAIGKLDFSWVNPSAEYQLARKSREIWKDSIRRIANTLGVNEAEVIITSGGSESNNLAILGLDHQYEILASKIEHPSIIESAKTRKHQFVDVDPNGAIDLDDLREKINDRVAIISVMLVNNEIGTIEPVKQIAQIIESVRKDRRDRSVDTPLYLHTDACQGPNYLNVQPKNLGVDMMSINSGKIYGPKGVGLLFLSSKIKGMSPIIHGGGQQRGMRSGTEDTAGVFGFSLALEKAQKQHVLESKRVSELRDKLAKGIVAIPDVEINGSMKNRIANNLNVSFVGRDNETIMMILDKEGVSVATGSACSASSDEPSHVLSAIGLNEPRIRGSIRLSLGHYTDEKSIENLINHLVRATKQ